MRIKNTGELVLRAQGHARSDHIEQGTYGQLKANGFAEFRGCAIGCLATPHRKRDLKALYRALMGGNRRSRHASGAYITTMDDLRQIEFSSDGLIRGLKREFGICSELARCAEAIFEAQELHGEAISFIPAFARALREGADITPRKLRKAWPTITENDFHAEVSEDLASAPFNAPGEAADRFLRWLKEQ